jgi:hypothetical protein
VCGSIINVDGSSVSDFINHKRRTLYEEAIRIRITMAPRSQMRPPPEQRLGVSYLC